MEQEEDKDEPTVERAQKGLGIHICEKCGHLHLGNHSMSQCSAGQLKNVGYFEAFGSAEFMVIACLVVHREWHLSTPYHCPMCYKGHPNHDCGYYFCHGVFDKYADGTYSVSPNIVGVVGAWCSICAHWHMDKIFAQCEEEEKAKA